MLISLIVVFSVYFLFIVSIIYQKRTIKDLHLNLWYLEKEQSKLYNLVDLLASAIPNGAARSLYRKLSEIPPEEYPEKCEEMSELIESFSNENFLHQRERLTKQIAEETDPVMQIKLKTKLEKLDELKNLTSLISQESSDDFRKTVIENINTLLVELNGELDEQ